MNVRMVVRMIVAVFVIVVMVLMIVSVIMRMLVRMRVGARGLRRLALGGQDVNLCRVDATAVGAVQIELNAKVKRIDSFLKNGNRNACVDERGEKHVSADAGETIEIGDLHRVVSGTVEADSGLFRSLLQPMVEAGRSLFMEPL